MAARKETSPKTNSPVSRRPVVGIVSAGIGTGLLLWLPLLWWCEAPPTELAISDARSSIERPDRAPLPKSAKKSDLAAKSAALTIPDSKSLSFGHESVAHDQGSLRHQATAEVEPALLDDLATTATDRPPSVETADDEPRPIPPEDDGQNAVATRVRVADEGTIKDRAVQPARVVMHEPVPVSVVPPAAPQPATSSGSNDEGGTIRLMHELHSEDPAIVEAAQQALARRGFSEVHLQLARTLTSPNPEERAQLAAKLPGVSGIDARLWLTWLLRDDSARVRTAALSVLATTGDPETLRRVLEIARQDRDPEVRAQLNNIDKMLRTGR